MKDKKTLRKLYKKAAKQYKKLKENVMSPRYNLDYVRTLNEISQELEKLKNSLK